MVSASWWMASIQLKLNSKQFKLMNFKKRNGRLSSHSSLLGSPLSLDSNASADKFALILSQSSNNFQRYFRNILLALVLLLLLLIIVGFTYVMINRNNFLPFNFGKSDGNRTDTSKFLSSVKYVHITPVYMEELRKLNKQLIPITYSDYMYRTVYNNPKLTRMALVDGRTPIGSITARFETSTVADVSFLHSDQFEEKHIYVMTIGVLPLYRRFGVGSQLLKEIEQEAKAYNLEGGHSVRLTALILHVQYNNTSAMEFYLSNGFKVAKDIPNYYVTVQP